MTAFS